MRVTDQIDALTTLSTDPMKYLVAPRILAATLALPLLVLVADILGVMGGWLIGTLKLGFVSAAYLKSTFDFLQTEDVALGPAQGGRVRLRHRADGDVVRLHQPRRRAGRGRGDDAAVVASSILILALDYALTEALRAMRGDARVPKIRLRGPAQGRSARSRCWTAWTSTSRPGRRR
jgi:phospholipid/cholesterol/gamma-HCH transport system permease protein